MNNKTVKKRCYFNGPKRGIVEEQALATAIYSGIISAVSFDVAIEANDKISNALKQGKVYFTPHIAYNTLESEVRQLDICVENIVGFINGKELNIVSKIKRL